MAPVPLRSDTTSAFTKTPLRTRSGRGLALIVPAIVLGFALATQWQTQSTRLPASTRYGVTLAEAAADLQREQVRLRSELAELRAELDAFGQQSATLGGQAEAIQRRIEELRRAAGLTPVTGAGLVVTLDDARVPANQTRRAIELGIVHATDLTDVFNTAWKAGAEAISVNGERITAASACVGAVIQVNGTLLSPPFVVTMVGPPDRLKSVFDAPQELADLKARRDAYGLGLTVERSERAEIPAYSGAITVKYARPLGP